MKHSLGDKQAPVGVICHIYGSSLAGMAILKKKNEWV